MYRKASGEDNERGNWPTAACRRRSQAPSSRGSLRLSPICGQRRQVLEESLPWGPNTVEPPASPSLSSSCPPHPSLLPSPDLWSEAPMPQGPSSGPFKTNDQSDLCCFLMLVGGFRCTYAVIMNHIINNNNDFFKNCSFCSSVVKIGSEGAAGVSMRSVQWSLTEGLLMKI